MSSLYVGVKQHLTFLSTNKTAETFFALTMEKMSC